jgi:hypothetical protein
MDEVKDPEHVRHLRAVGEAEVVGRKPNVRSNPIKAAQKRRTALELRAAGLSYEQIAEQMTSMGMKMSERGVQSLITRTLDKMVQVDQKNADQVRQLELARLDQLMAILWPKVRSGDIKAIKEYRGCIDQRARLIGTYAAVKHEFHGKIEGLVGESEREEIEREHEAFLASGGDVVDAEVVGEDEPLGLPAPPANVEAPA